MQIPLLRVPASVDMSAAPHGAKMLPRDVHESSGYNLLNSSNELGSKKRLRHGESFAQNINKVIWGDGIQLWEQ